MYSLLRSLQPRDSRPRACACVQTLRRRSPDESITARDDRAAFACGRAPPLCRAIGITVPIIPGIMPIMTYGGFNRMTGFCKTKASPATTMRLSIPAGRPSCLPIRRPTGLVRTRGAAPHSRSSAYVARIFGVMSAVGGSCRAVVALAQVPADIKATLEGIKDNDEAVKV
jgi:hypothetical protein